MRLKCVEKRGGGGNGDKEKERRKINEKDEGSCGSWVMVYEDGNRLRQQWEHATSFSGTTTWKNTAELRVTTSHRFGVRLQMSQVPSWQMSFICTLTQRNLRSPQWSARRPIFFAPVLSFVNVNETYRGGAEAQSSSCKNTKKCTTQISKRPGGGRAEKMSYWLCRTPIVSRTMDADKPWLL